MTIDRKCFSRRDVLTTGGRLGIGLGLAGTGLLSAPAIIMAEGRRPTVEGGVMSGDALTDRTMLGGAPACHRECWSRWPTTRSFAAPASCPG